MHMLVISDGINTVTFPKTRNITHAGELEGTATVMSDGTEMFDVVGFRKNVTYVYDYVPQAIFDDLMPMLRRRRYVTATVLDVDNKVRTQLYSVIYPTAEAYKLTENGAVWHNVKIVLKAKEVVNSDSE